MGLSQRLRPAWPLLNLLRYVSSCFDAGGPKSPRQLTTSRLVLLFSLHGSSILRKEKVGPLLPRVCSWLATPAFHLPTYICLWAAKTAVPLTCSFNCLPGQGATGFWAR